MQLIHELRVVDISTDRRGAIYLYTPLQTGEMIPASIITRLLWMELIYPKVTNFPRMSLDGGIEIEETPQCVGVHINDNLMQPTFIVV